jgi:hypothetical protein
MSFTSSSGRHCQHGLPSRHHSRGETIKITVNVDNFDIFGNIQIGEGKIKIIHCILRSRKAVFELW